MPMSWRVGDRNYDPKKAIKLRDHLQGLIGSMHFGPNREPYVELGGDVCGRGGLAIRNFTGMESHVFKAFHHAAEKVFLEVMID
jgi:hypothetical protein